LFDVDLIAILSIGLYTLIGVYVFLNLILVVAWFIYVPVVVRVFSETPFLLADSSQPVTGGEDCLFHTADGLMLRGTYFTTPAGERLGVIAFCHELTSDRWSAMRYVSELHERGFDVFSFDFRNHGQSDRQSGYEPMPWVTRYELNDVRAAVDYLASRDDADPRGVGLLGVSRGAAAALCAASLEPRIRCVVTDGAFPLEEMQLHYMRRYMEIYLPHFSWLLAKLPDHSLATFCRWARLIVGLRRRCRFLHVTQMTRRVRQPVFMIHGKRDTYVPLEVVQELRASLPRRPRLWVVPEAKHNRSIDVATHRYRRRIARFFQQHLAGGRSLAPLAAAELQHPTRRVG
jgi:pimeloyl-ACP methyl ester carboxylesterase